MILSCSALFTDTKQQEFFCKRIRALGGIPCEIQNEVILLYEGDKEAIAQLVALFEQQNNHKVQVTDKTLLN